MMALNRTLGGLLLGSAVCLAFGGALLYAFSLVPQLLLEITTSAVIVLVPLAYYVVRGNKIAINVSTGLGVVAPLISLSTPSHVDVLLSFGRIGFLFSLLAALQALGFYVFPIAFVFLRLAFRKKIVFASPRRIEMGTSFDQSRFTEPQS